MKIYINDIFKLKKLKGNYKERHKEEYIKNSDELKSDNEIKTITEENIVNNIRKNTYKRKGAANNSLDFDINKKINIKKQTLPKSYYALLILMLGLAGFSVKLVKDANQEYMIEENYAVFNSKDNDITDVVNESNNNDSLQNNETSNIDTRGQVEEVSSVSSNDVINKVQEKINTVVQKKEAPLVFTKPHKGEISKIYSSDKVIYSKTLEMWKTHDGIDIKGEIGDIVYSAERGTVEKVYEDAFYGITIVINHGQGYKTSYSNLNDDTLVNEGDTVKKSQKIGKIGATSIGEIKDAPHLHFMLYKNNVVADPTSIF